MVAHDECVIVAVAVVIITDGLCGGVYEPNGRFLPFLLCCLALLGVLGCVACSCYV